jgi:DNA-binding Lrp family transcriptional regulator
MLNYFYPPDQRSLFTNRHAELAVLDLLKTQVLRGEPQRLAVWGQRRIGKTLLLKEFCARLLEENWGGLLAYVDVETIASSPENFALGYIGHLLLWYSGRWAGLPPAFLDSGSLAEAAASAELQSIRQTVGALSSQLLQEKPNRQTLLSLAFQLPERVARESGRPAIVILDEFCEILSLDRYEGVQVLPLFRGLMEQSSVSYILAGSAMSAMRWMADDHESPLFAQLDRLSLSGFTPDDVQELAGKLTAERYDTETVSEITRLSGRHPYYVRCLVRRLESLQHLYHLPPSAETVRYAFLIEALSTEGNIYNFCRYVYDTSLHKAVGYGPLKAIMQLLAEGEEAPARIARRLKVSQPAAWGYLRRLEEVDLLIKENGAYSYQDPVLRFWVMANTRGIQVSPFPRQEDLTGLINLVQERFQRASSELGVAKEFETRELLRHFAGQTVPGELFGLPDSITLPTFASVEAWRSADGQVELDAVARNNETWLVELKWRRRAASVRDVQRFVDKAATVPHQRLWFISRDGFSAAARHLVQEQGILISDERALQRLERLVGLRFG